MFRFSMHFRARPLAGKSVPTAAAIFLASTLLASCSQPGDTPVDPETGLPTATTFSKSYGGPAVDIAHAVTATSDGGILLVGHGGGEHGAGQRVDGGDVWIGKLDANGNPEVQRLIGLVPTGTHETITKFNRVRVTADNGYIAVGSNGGSIAVARFNAQGVALWARTYHSGPWLNYERTTGGGAGPVGDIGRDVWQLPDGGFWVVADSAATLRDTHNIGFDGPNNQSDVFVSARSVYAMRLDADGNVRFDQRLTDNAFGFYSRDRFDWPIIRATADGGAMIARHKRFTETVDAVGGTRQVERNFALVHRLGGDASLLWTRRLSDEALIPNDIIQTDDPVDLVPGNPFPGRDGASDDGFLFAGSARHGCARLYKLRPNGETEWDKAYGCADLSFSGPDEFAFSSLVEQCVGGVCFFVIGGSRELDEEDPRGIIHRILADGGELDTTLIVDAAVQRVERLSRRPDGDYAAITRDFFGVGQIYTLRGSDLGLVDRATISAQLEHDFELETTPEGGALVLSPAGRLVRVSSDGAEQSRILLAARGERTDRGLTALELAPGRFIVAGDSRSFSETEGAEDVRTEAWVAAYDMPTGQADRIAWQRRLQFGLSGQITGLAPAGDGGVVVAGRFSGAILAAKLDGNGELVWQSAPLQTNSFGTFTALREMVATPDGGFVLLMVEDKFTEGGTGAGVVKLDSNGVVQWKKRYFMSNPGSIDTVDADGDGSRDDGFVLAGRAIQSIDLGVAVRIDSEGEILWSKAYQPTSLNHWEGVSEDFPRIRQLPDGGFVLAVGELGTISTLDSEGEELPYGQSNVLLLKIGSGGTAQWGRIYGALYDEGISDLDVTADGSILLAGYSDSFGDVREAWLLKLGSDGRIGSGSCNCFLGNLPDWYLSSRDERVDMEVLHDPGAARHQLIALETHAPMRTVSDFVVARQCLGNANPPDAPPRPMATLSVTQAGTGAGPVISTPRGLACGTGLGDSFCTARFPVGARIELRADVSNFRRWETACDENTGGESLVCVVVLDRDRNIAVNFARPVTPTLFPFRVAVQGDGRVTGENLSCREGSPESACEGLFPEGRVLNFEAVADADRRFIAWTGDCQQLGSQTQIAVTVTGPLECFAQFSIAGQGDTLVSVAVEGQGIVRDETQSAIACREGGTLEECSELYGSIRTITLTATPDANHRFTTWGGACAQFGSLPTAQLVTAQDQSCTALFTPIVQSPLLTVLLDGGPANASVISSPGGILCTNGTERDCTQFYAAGTEVRLLASPAIEFAAWENCDSVLDMTTCVVTMNASRNVVARYR